MSAVVSRTTSVLMIGRIGAESREFVFEGEHVEVTIERFEHTHAEDLESITIFDGGKRVATWSGILLRNVRRNGWRGTALEAGIVRAKCKFGAAPGECKCP